MNERLERLIVRARTPQWVNWWLPLAIFAVSRVIDAVLVIAYSHAQGAIIHGEKIEYVENNMPANPGYLGMLTNWDGQWYQSISHHGYPGYLQVDQFGHVEMNSWAFFPLFPGLTRLVMFATADNFALAATIVSTACAGLAMVLLFTMIRESGGLFLATISVVSLSLSPAAVVFQAAYSEGPALLMIMICLWLLRRQRYGWLLLAGIALSLARPVVGALAIVIAIHWFHRRRTDPTFTKRQQIWVGFVCGLIGLSFFLWIGVCGLVLGHSNAYQLTQDAWAGWKWDQVSMGWDSWLYGLVSFKLSGLIALVVVVYFVWLMRRPAAAGLGTELRLWTPIYAFYVLAATRVTPSVVRYLMLVAVPWWPVPACADWSLRQRRAQIAILLTVVVGVFLQYAWVESCFVVSTGKFWSVFHGYP